MDTSVPSQSLKLNLPQLIFISLISAANVGFDMLLSPGLIAVFSHIITGVLIMVPVNFLFISLTKYIVNDKFGSLTLYMTIFGVIASPTTFYGAIPGLYKVLVGVTTGILLDLVFLIKKPILTPIAAGVFGGIVWWMGSFGIWTAFDFPYVTGFSVLFNAVFPISGFIGIPVQGFSPGLFLFTLICGLFSAGPVIAACFISYGLFLKIKKTAVYDRFTNME